MPRGACICYFFGQVGDQKYIPHFGLLALCPSTNDSKSTVPEEESLDIVVAHHGDQSVFHHIGNDMVFV